jgi:hypothetical protein
VPGASNPKTHGLIRFGENIGKLWGRDETVDAEKGNWIFINLEINIFLLQ